MFEMEEMTGMNEMKGMNGMGLFPIICSNCNLLLSAINWLNLKS